MSIKVGDKVIVKLDVKNTDLDDVNKYQNRVGTVKEINSQDEYPIGVEIKTPDLSDSIDFLGFRADELEKLG